MSYPGKAGGRGFQATRTAPGRRLVREGSVGNQRT